MDKLREIFSREITEADLATLNALRQTVLSDIDKLENIQGELDDIKTLLSNNDPEPQQETLDDIVDNPGE